jgi:hypothetical protein
MSDVTEISSEIYDITKLAFIETLGLAGVEISFKGNDKFCIAGPIDRKSYPGESGGFVLEATTQIDMLDEDFDAWGAENLDLIEIDDLQLQILSIRRRSGNPIVHLSLKKNK